MKDVASLAGVSLATVSRVLSGRADVHPDLAERVQDAVRKLGYRRDHMASTLRRADRQSSSLGLILENVSNPFFSAVHRGIEVLARERAVLTLAGSSDDDVERERSLAEAFASRAVDGLVIVPSRGDQSYLARERDAGVALVFVDRAPHFIDADVVLSDNEGGMRTAVTHLATSGHQRIAHLGDRSHLQTAQERLAGYRSAVRDLGLEVDPALQVADLDDEDLTIAAVERLLSDPHPPSAICTGQNLVTLAAVRALRQLGRQHDVALVGFDDVPAGDLLDPGVTVIAQDPVGLGRRAAERLFERIDGYDGPSRRDVLPTTLIARGSGELSP